MTLSRQSGERARRRLAMRHRRTISDCMTDQDSSTPAAIGRRRLLALLAATPFTRHRTVAAAQDTGMLPWHHRPDGTFRNPQGSPERGGSPAEWRSFLWRRLVQGAPAPKIPDGHVLSAAAALDGIAAAQGGDAVTWLGHASFLIRLGGRTILTDPFLTERASPFPWAGPRRIAGPGVMPSQLPPIDLLLLSHNHYDHLDLRALAQLRDPGRIAVAMPLRMSRYLDTARYARAVELDWRQEAELAGIRVTALPAIHFSKRGLFDRNASLWCGFMLEAGGRRILFTGDTAYGPVFKETAAQVALPDLALVPIGAYEPRPLMAGSHCTPEEGVAIGHEFGAKRLCGMHWGTILLTDEPAFEPPARFTAAALAAGYAEVDAWVLSIGETRAL
jgi:N-acyl-phosphatidylethanolamine-hydrolysing phospholipase D